MDSYGLDTYGMDTCEGDTDSLGHLWLGHLEPYGLDIYGLDTYVVSVSYKIWLFVLQWCSRAHTGRGRISILIISDIAFCSNFIA